MAEIIVNSAAGALPAEHAPPPPDDARPSFAPRPHTLVLSNHDGLFSFGTRKSEGPLQGAETGGDGVEELASAGTGTDAGAPLPPSARVRPVGGAAAPIETAHEYVDDFSAAAQLRLKHAFQRAQEPAAQPDAIAFDLMTVALATGVEETERGPEQPPDPANTIIP